jgi:nitroreductase
MENKVLRSIRERRSVTEFLPSEPDEDALRKILESGRWAPSWINSQPWNFIVLIDKEAKRKLGDICSNVTASSKASFMQDAAVVIITVVDPEKDPYHYKEDGAIATYNMALAAHSLGYGSYYLGIFGDSDKKVKAEEEIKELLKVPEKLRIAAVLPIGISEKSKQPTRKPLDEIVHYNTWIAS